MRIFAVLLVMLLGVAPARPVSAHALDPGYLDLEPMSDTTWRATWRKPQVQGRPMPINAVLPEGCSPRTGPEAVAEGRAFVSRWIVECPEGLASGLIRIEGLESTQTDVLLRYRLVLDGPSQTHRFTPDATTFRMPETLGTLDVAWTYFFLGVDHILEGLDHLLFVFALLFLVQKPRKIIGAVTAFTVAHSITLGAAAFGFLVIPAPFVEALIALSIVILATEIVRRKHTPAGLSERFPWIVAFGFGLLHGLGFARALLDIGLPEADIVLALLAFNIGVEAGQLLFVAAVLFFGFVLARLWPVSKKWVLVGAGGRVAAGYAIGTLAAFWTLDRVTGFWG